MKLIVNLKLNPTKEQYKALKQTLETANEACDWISDYAFAERVFGQFQIHKLTYVNARRHYKLSAQMTVRCIAKVADAYKISKDVQRKFKKHGSIAYDDRIISFKTDDRVSIWTFEGRLTIPFQCGEYQRKYLPYRKGEVDLVYRKGEFYLNCVCDIEELPTKDGKDFLGVDFGIVNLATTSDGASFTGEQVEKTRQHYHDVRKSIQQKKVKGRKRSCWRALKRISKHEQNFRKHTNHVISKQLVLSVKGTSRNIAVEDLTGINKRSKRFRKTQRAKRNGWSFYQLRQFVEYKAQLNGVRVIAVEPAYTSQTCNECGHCEKQNRKSQSEFVCVVCNHTINADINAAKNIRQKAFVTMPKESESVAFQKAA